MIKKFLAGLALAVLLTVVPACAQTASPSDEKIAIHMVVIGEPDTAAKTFLGTMNEAMSKLNVIPKAADTNDETAPEFHVLVVGSDDKETFVTVLVLFHVKGSEEPVYLGMMGGVIKPEEAADDAHDVMSKAADAFDGFIEELESEPSPAPTAPQKQSDHSLIPDTYSHA
jgi:hypothetical protein